MTPNPLRLPGLLPKASLEPDEHVSVHRALRDTNRTGDEIRPLMLVGDPCYRVFAPNWYRLEQRLLTLTTTGQNLAPSILSERRPGASAAISTELSSSTLIDAGRARPAPHDQPERPLRRPF